MNKLLVALLLGLSFVACRASDVECLARNIYHEARGECHKGKVAVAAVTVNRTKHKSFRPTVCQVVHQPGQFSWVPYGPRVTDLNAYRDAKELAVSYLSGDIPDPTGGALYFKSAKLSRPNSYQKICNHIFYK